MVIGIVPVAMQPQRDAAALGDAHHILEIAQTVRRPLGFPVGDADRIMRHEDARSSVQSVEKFFQTPELIGADRAAGVPGPAIGRRGIHRHQPDRPDALCERIDRIPNTLADLPGSEVALEVAAPAGGARAVIVIARHRQSRQLFLGADAQQHRRLAKLLFKAHRRGVAGEDDAVEAPLLQLHPQRGQDSVGVTEVPGTAEDAEIDPRRHAFVEPVARPPGAGGSGDMDVADVGQADGGGVAPVDGEPPSTDHTVI